MGDHHPNSPGVEGDKAVGVLPDVVHDTVQPRLSLHQDEHLGHWQVVEGSGNPHVVHQLVLHCIAAWGVCDKEASID